MPRFTFFLSPDESCLSLSVCRSGGVPLCVSDQGCVSFPALSIISPFFSPPAPIGAAPELSGTPVSLFEDAPDPSNPSTPLRTISDLSASPASPFKNTPNPSGPPASPFGDAPNPSNPPAPPASPFSNQTSAVPSAAMLSCGIVSISISSITRSASASSVIPEADGCSSIPSTSSSAAVTVPENC